MATGLDVTRNIGTWDVFNHHVERDMDQSTYSAGHPDDVLLLVGPPRLSSVKSGETSGVGSLMALGQIQMASLSSSVPLQPSKGIGSSRRYYLMDSPQNMIQMTRLVMNSRNLLRAFYHSAVEAGIDVGDRNLIGTEASYTDRKNQQWWVNLDSPIFRLPIGLGFLFRDRGGSHIGGVYAELARLQQWSVQIASGQSALMENVSLMSDRFLPFGDSAHVGDLAKLFDKALGDAAMTIDAKQRAGETDKLS